VRGLLDEGLELVLHAAAWTDVERAEDEPQAAAAVNVGGTQHVVALGVPLVYFSTDYVFDGRKGAPYVEDDPPAPLSAYGRTKLAGERAALARHPDGTRIARTAWLYGAGGRNFVDTMRRLGAEREAVEVVDDQVGSPTWTRDLAPALEALLDLPPGVYHAAGAGAVSWAGLAAAVFEEGGLACRVRPIATARLGRPAPRPALSALAVTRPGAPRLRHWREALRDYLGEVS
jgi:dTDP-4-dehydrorhamnose reductase